MERTGLNSLKMSGALAGLYSRLRKPFLNLNANRAGFPRQFRAQSPNVGYFIASPAVLPHAVAGASGCATARAVHPADGPALHGGGLAADACPLGLGTASGRTIQAKRRVHGVAVAFHHTPLPPTAPTIA